MFAKLLITSAADKNKIVEFFKFSIALHILLSLLIMKPYYVKEFFTDEYSLSFAGNLSIISGAMAGFLLLRGKQFFKSHKRRQHLVLIFAGLHLFFMGIDGWISPMDWNGHLPPITLIGFILIIILLFFPSKNLYK